jgi:uncharacterized membrane protein
MKQSNIVIPSLCAAALIALLSACSTTNTATTTTTGANTQLVVQLTAAGFAPFTAKTDAQREHIRSLPADKITKVTWHEKDMWVYPDAANNQVYVGNSKDYQAFRKARLAQTNLDSEEDMVFSFKTRGPGRKPVDVYDGFVPMNALD